MGVSCTGTRSPVFAGKLMGAGATSLFTGLGSAVQRKRCRNAMEVGAGNQLLETRLVRGGRG